MHGPKNKIISQYDIAFSIRKCFRHVTTNMILKVYATIIWNGKKRKKNSLAE